MAYMAMQTGPVYDSQSYVRSFPQESEKAIDRKSLLSLGVCVCPLVTDADSKRYRPEPDWKQ